MITEIALVSAAYSTMKNWDKITIYWKWRQITYSKSGFTNRLEKTLKILNIERTDYGHIIKIELPYSYTFEDMEKDKDVFKEALHYKSIQLKNEANIVYMYCVKQFEFKNYIPLKLPPYKLLVADGLTGPIVVNMNDFPHMLIGGSTGTGKSRVLLLMLSNLIKFCNDVEIYLLQIRKGDLGVFQDCHQVKVNSKTIFEVLDSLKKIDKECQRREVLIDNRKGYYSIEDYNKVAYNKLKYVYVVIDEFSFLNVSKGDCKEEKQLKFQCLKYIKSIVNVGRSSGIFLITSLQKPTNDSLPSDIKDQLCTRIALKIKDGPPAMVIMGNVKATKLEVRELICSTLNEEQGYSYTMDHAIVTENIKHRFVERKEIVSPVIKSNDILELLNEINK
jgi:S-DNA-T family DNA segregation ATPase FtsK/SpoIIIE